MKKKIIYIGISFVLIVAIVLSAYFLLGKFGLLGGEQDPNNDTEQDNSQESQNLIYTITFDSNGGSAVSEQKIKHGEMANYPAFPTREGFLFVGWYTNAKFDERFDFSAPIMQSCTVIARWLDIEDATDTDLDGLVDTLEEYYKTDKTKPDTDNDGLNDYWEILLNLDPLSDDTDKNGIKDGDEDFDSDSINNKQEIELGTNPTLADTDGDNLSDGDEINVCHTDALLSDTDNDGANDGWEVDNSFDPCLYNESFHVTVIADGGENSAVTAMVEMEANGKQVSFLTVEAVLTDENILLSNSIPGYLGQAYEFFTCEEINCATISFEYSADFEELSGEFQPRIYYFNEIDNVLEELDNQTVTNETVSVEVSHFSKYILLNKYLYDLAWESEIVLPSMAEEKGIDVTTDSNDDGISDYYSNLIKQGKLLSSTGQNLFGGIDFNIDDDYDGDGIINGNEIRIVEFAYRVFYKVESNPTIADSDQDGFRDGEDPDPWMWDVSYRDLALLAKAVYFDIPGGTHLANVEPTKNIIMLSNDKKMIVGRLEELKGWKVLESVYNPLTGFEASAYAKDKNIVIATRGSESHNLADVLQDWVCADIIGYLYGFNIQLPAMETFVDHISQKYGYSYDNFYVTGHSLGGYLALMSASRLVENELGDKIEEVITFNGLGLSDAKTNKYGVFLDIDDNIHLQLIRSKIKNYRTLTDVVSVIGYTPGNDITVSVSPNMKAISLGEPHAITNFIERFSNELRHPSYDVTLYGLNDELGGENKNPDSSDNNDSNENTELVLDTPYYTLTVPQEWLGKFTSEKWGEDGASYHFSIREKISAEENYPGYIFTLYMIRQGEEFYHPNAYIIKTFLTDGEKYDIWVVTPTDFDVAPDGIENYQLMCNSMLSVLNSLELKNAVTDITDDNEDPPTSSNQLCLAVLEPILSEHYEGNEGDSRIFILEGEEYRNGNIGISGECYQNGFEVWIARWNNIREISWVRNVYALEGKCTLLSGKTGVIADSYNSSNFNTTLYFYGDGTLLDSIIITDEDYQHEFEIDVSNVQELEIFVQDNVAVCGGTSFALYDLFLTGDFSDLMNPPSASDAFSWEFDQTTGTVIISGTGKLPDYHCDYDPAPWDELGYFDLLKHMVIKDGITEIGSFTFTFVDESVTIPKSVTKIGALAFADASRLQTVYYQGTEAEWDNMVIDYAGNEVLDDISIVYLEDGN